MPDRRRPLRRFALLAAGLALAAPVEAATWIPPAVPLWKPTPCIGSGLGRDLTVGPGGTYAEVTDVPWETLAAGDTVRIFWRATPYRGKFMISAKGTAAAPVRVCGVRSPTGARPVISGENAVSRPQLKGAYASDDYGIHWHEGRGIVFVGINRNTDVWTDKPSHIQIDGLAFQKVHPNYTYTDTTGQIRAYVDFGAAIWIHRGWTVTIADNEISDVTHAIFSRSIADATDDFEVTKDLTIARNTMWNAGVAGSQTIHTTYVQSRRTVYEFNRYGPLRKGAKGSGLKDRSSGTIIRFNRIEDGARALDLVEPEDWSPVALADPAFRTTLVYGNQILKDGRKGSTIHYGGDHMGSEATFRKGTLYFYGNSVFVWGRDYAAIFQPSTIDERIAAWDNVFFPEAGLDPRGSPTGIQIRTNHENDAGIPDGGRVELGRNWIWSNWTDNGPWGKPIGGTLTGTANLVTGDLYPISILSFVPGNGRGAIDRAVGTSAGNAAVVRYHPVNHELLMRPDRTFVPTYRRTIGSAPDLGAVERP